MALKIVFLALLLLLVCCASEAQTQGNDTSLPLVYNSFHLLGDRSACAVDRQRQQTRQIISNDVDALLKNTLVRQLGHPLSHTLLHCPCMPEGRRIAYLDMTDSRHNCPAGWKTYTSPKRACGRNQTAAGCRSIIYPTFGITYTHICGHIVAYQFYSTLAFYTYSSSTTIDGTYVDGFTITHGNPREHVWTFASAYGDASSSGSYICPCTNSYGNANGVPSFLDNDYFCDSGTGASSPSSIFYSGDPLWDGKGCATTSTCCEFNNPPWFCKALPQPTTDDIEVRICGYRESAVTDVPVELMELYIS